ncbi:MAG: hypothetical protein ACOY0T_22395 [Myxococcota bacterium]
MNFLAPERLELSRGETQEFVFGTRSVTLCNTHAHIVRALRVTTLGALRDLFRENAGQRSLLPRRQSTELASSDERRRWGRRASDRPSA